MPFQNRGIPLFNRFRKVKINWILIDCSNAFIFAHTATLNWTQLDLANVRLGIRDDLWESDFYALLILTGEIANGSLKIIENGSIQHGAQRYADVVHYN